MSVNGGSKDVKDDAKDAKHSFFTLVNSHYAKVVAALSAAEAAFRHVMAALSATEAALRQVVATSSAAEAA